MRDDEYRGEVMEPSMFKEGSKGTSKQSKGGSGTGAVLDRPPKTETGGGGGKPPNKGGIGGGGDDDDEPNNGRDGDKRKFTSEEKFGMRGVFAKAALR